MPSKLPEWILCTLTGCAKNRCSTVGAREGRGPLWSSRPGAGTFAPAGWDFVEKTSRLWYPVVAASDSGQALSANAGGHAPFPAQCVGRDDLFLLLVHWYAEKRNPPAAALRKGGCSMKFSEVAVLLSLLGGAILATFEITWKISNQDKDRKKK